MEKVLVEGEFGHGGIPSTYDVRDHKASRLGMAVQPFDWDKGFDIEEKIGAKIITEDQGQSSSCGGQAARYYIGVLNALQTGVYTRMSAKDSYCKIFYPGGGTTIRDIGKQVGNHGLAREVSVPSYQGGNAPTEWFMESTSVSDVVGDSVRFAPVSAYARPKLDIDSIAAAIRDNNGVIVRINGENNGTWLSSFPKPPGSKVWSHFMYGGKARLINGKRYIGLKQSWGKDVGDEGWQWLGEDYPFQEALVFYDQATYTYVPSTPQKVVSWMQAYPWIRGFLDFINKYKWY